jgi:hypothetical protein
MMQCAGEDGPCGTLEQAVRRNHVECVSFLLWEEGHELMLSESTRDDPAHPLMLAIRLGFGKVLQVLVDFACNELYGVLDTRNLDGSATEAMRARTTLHSLAPAIVGVEPECRDPIERATLIEVPLTCEASRRRWLAFHRREVEAQRSEAADSWREAEQLAEEQLAKEQLAKEQLAKEQLAKEQLATAASRKRARVDEVMKQQLEATKAAEAGDEDGNGF